jgi:squalene-hopene/tetraprenyl-beta-curcumene cyclase
MRFAASTLLLLLLSAIAYGASDTSWDPKAAASYLDGRANWWVAWSGAARDHETFCISCHTGMPYAIARPALRAALGERQPTAAEAKMLDVVARRVALWKDADPWYPDQTRGIPKTSESRGTEAVINALVLATRDRDRGHLAGDTRAAFDHMWALQMRTQALSGAWPWLNFHYEPWESSDAPYFGAALAVVATGTAPDGYAADPSIQENLKLLRAYAQREAEHQPLLNRALMLWASSKVADVLTAAQRQAIAEALLAAQQEDGGWSMSSLGTFKRVDDTPIETQTDGYATSVVTLALQNAGGAASSDPRVRKGLDWLRRHQDRSTGQWTATSLNKRRDPASDPGRFMNDAASAYAVLSLTAARSTGGTDR